RALELTTQTTQPARLISATIIEGHELRARRVFEPPRVGIAAFLDGTQQSSVVHYLPGGVPIVLGTVAAVIRDRRNQRLFTWKHLVERRWYVSRRHLSETEWNRLGDLGLEIRDIADGEEGESEHPL